MHLAGYLDKMTPNDWFSLAYVVFVTAAIVWALFRPGDDT